MGTIKIDEEFKGLLPELSRATFESLEENILLNGCLDPLVLWGDILIDGHSRYEICTKHGVPFSTVSKEFASREEALIWIISSQVSRRNLTPLQLSHFRGLHYGAVRKIQGTYGRNAAKNENPRNGNPHGSTVVRLSMEYNVSKNTIGRDVKIAEAIEAIGHASPAAKKMILDGDVNVGKLALEALAARPREFIAEVARQIEDGTYDKKHPLAAGH